MIKLIRITSFIEIQSWTKKASEQKTIHIIPCKFGLALSKSLSGSTDLKLNLLLLQHTPQNSYFISHYAALWLHDEWTVTV